MQSNKLNRALDTLTKMGGVGKRGDRLAIVNDDLERDLGAIITMEKTGKLHNDVTIDKGQLARYAIDGSMGMSQLAITLASACNIVGVQSQPGTLPVMLASLDMIMNYMHGVKERIVWLTEKSPLDEDNRWLLSLLVKYFAKCTGIQDHTLLVECAVLLYVVYCGGPLPAESEYVDGWDTKWLSVEQEIRLGTLPQVNVANITFRWSPNEHFAVVSQDHVAAQIDADRQLAEMMSNEPTNDEQFALALHVQEDEEPRPQKIVDVVDYTPVFTVPKPARFEAPKSHKVQEQQKEEFNAHIAHIDATMHVFRAACGQNTGKIYSIEQYETVPEFIYIACVLLDLAPCENFSQIIRGFYDSCERCRLINPDLFRLAIGPVINEVKALTRTNVSNLGKEYELRAFIAELISMGKRVEANLSRV